MIFIILFILNIGLAASQEISELKILVVIPESLIMHPRVPDPAAETEIIRKLIDEGFNVVDQQLIGDIRYSQYVSDAYHNEPDALSYLSDRYAIDILIIGEAFSEETGERQGVMSFKARVEVKAIQTKNRKIIASNYSEAVGLDVSPFLAGKKALRNAGLKIADYLINKLKSLDY